MSRMSHEQSRLGYDILNARRQSKAKHIAWYRPISEKGDVDWLEFNPQPAELATGGFRPNTWLAYLSKDCPSPILGETFR